MGGWVCLWRSIMDHPVWEDPTTLKVFLWCVLTARREAKEWRGDMLQPGQFSTGRNVASRELGLHPSSVYRAFDRLTAMGCITVEANRVRTIVTVCNWSSYQEQDREERASSEQDANKDRTSIEQEANTIQQRNKETREQVSEEIPPTPRQRGKGSPKPAKPKFDPSTFPIPKTLQVFDFTAKAWPEWIEYRREMRKPLTERMCRDQLEDMARAGPAAAVAAIRQSMKIGWTGVFPDGSKNGRSAPPPGSGQKYDPASIPDELDLVGTL